MTNQKKVSKFRNQYEMFSPISRRNFVLLSCAFRNAIKVVHTKASKQFIWAKEVDFVVSIESNPWNIAMRWVECISFHSHLMVKLYSFLVIGAGNDVVSYFGRHST